MEKIDINALPVRVVDLDELGGMTAISLVSDPAMEAGWEYFSKEKQLFAIQDEEKHIVMGPVIRVDHKILRKDAKTGDFYALVFTKDVAKDMLQRFLVDGFQNVVSVEHNGVQVDGVEPLEFFIKDVAKGVNPKGFDDVADGSVFASYHVVNDDVWNAVKAGTFTGFSLEAWFSTKEVMSKDRDWVDTLLEVLS